MDDKDMLEIDIDDIKNAYNKLQEAMNDLEDVDGLDEKIIQDINTLAEMINDLRIEKESKLERIADEEYFESQKTQWEKEQREQENEYWKSQF